MEIQINDTYSTQSKISYLQISQYLNCLQVLLSIPIICITAQSVSDDYSIMLLGIAILAGITIFVSIISFISQNSSLGKKHLIDYEKDNNSLGKIFFILFTLLIILFIIFLIDMMMLKNSFFKKSQIQQSLGGTAFSIDWTFTQYIEIFSITFLILFLTVNAFLKYIVYANINTIRQAVLIYNLFFTIVTLITLLVLKYLNEHYTSSHFQHFQNNWVLQVVKVFSYISLVASVVCILVVHLKLKIPNFVFGGLLFFFLFFIICFAGIIFRDASQIRSYYMHNCAQEIRLAHKDFIESTGCPFKYQTTVVAGTKMYNTQCPADQLGLVWETSGATNAQRLNQFACLNYNCCDNLADSYSIPFYNVALSWISQSLFGFCMVWGFFYLSRRKQKEYDIHDSIDWIFGLIVIILIITGIILLTVKDYKPKSISQIAIDEIKRVHKNAIPDKIEINKSPKVFPQEFAPACQNIFANDPNKKQILFSATKQYMQICLLGTNGYFVLNPLYKSSEIYIYSMDRQDEDIPFTNVKESDGLQCIEGKKEELKNFLVNDLKFCQEHTWIKSKITVKYKELDALEINSISPSARILEEGKVKSQMWNKIKFKHRSSIPEASNVNIAQETMNKYKWGNAKLHIYDAETLNPIESVKLEIYIGEISCSQTIHTIFKNGETNKQGEYIFYNLVAAQGYYFTAHVKKDGYKVGCKVFSVEDSKQNSEAFSDVYLTLIPNFKLAVNINYFQLFKKNSFAVSLEWDNPQIELYLQSAFNYGDKTCRVGFFNQECGYMKYYPQFKASKNYASQLITVDQLAKYKYLFYVQKLPISTNPESIKAFQQEQSQGGEVYLAADDTTFTTANPLLKMYVNELQYPVFPIQNFDVANLEVKDKKEPNLIWLGLCVDGQEGAVSCSKVNKFWSRVSSSARYDERTFTERDNFPGSQKVCAGLYQELAEVADL